MTTVLIDLDNVLANWDAGFYDFMHRMHPHVPSRSPLLRAEYDINTHYRSYPAEVEFVMNHPDLYDSLAPMAGSQQAIGEMLDAGLDLLICSVPTISNPTCASAKYDWVSEFYGRELADRLILTLDKTRVMGDYLIDDKPEVTGAVAPTWEHILFSHNYNRDMPQRRINGWHEWRNILQPAIAAA